MSKHRDVRIHHTPRPTVDVYAGAQAVEAEGAPLGMTAAVRDYLLAAKARHHLRLRGIVAAQYALPPGDSAQGWFVRDGPGNSFL